MKNGDSSHHSLAINLHSLFSTLRPCLQQRLKLQDAWRLALGVEQNNPTTLYEIFKMISSSLDMIARQINDCPGIDRSRNRYLFTIKNCRTLVDILNMAKPTSEFVSILDGDKIDYFLSLEDFLATKFPIGQIESNEINRILEQIDEVKGAIENSSLDEELVSYLLGQIEILVWSIRNVNLMGIDNIYELSVSMASRFYTNSTKYKIDERDQSVFEKALKLFRGLRRVLQAAIQLDRGSDAINNLSNKLLG